MMRPTGNDTGRVRGGRRDGAEEEELPEHHSTTRTGRKRYCRLFPERLDFLLAHLTPPQLAAYLHILSEFVVRDGKLSSADSDMRRVANLSAGAWAELRDTLIAYGLAHIEGEFWVDADQCKNLEIQKKTSERQRANVAQRWKRLKVA